LINTGSLIDHDNDFGDYSSTGPGVSTGGNVSVGALSYIGIGASVRHGIRVGRGSVIGGQAFVDRDIGDHLVCYGVPARPVRAQEEGARYL
jgi:acetyltransferase EpsM